MTDIALVKQQRDDLLRDSDDFQCAIASALGWPDDGVPFAEAVARLVAENQRLLAGKSTTYDLEGWLDAGQVALIKKRRNPMSEHTQGPWEVVPEKNNPLYCHVYDVARRSLGQIATVHSKDADARLIAASPDLLSACQQVSDAIKVFGATLSESHIRLCEEVLDNAIAKATW